MRVDFHFGAQNRFRDSCFILQKHFFAGKQFLVYLSDPRALAHFDRLLWGFQPTAFVPHAMADAPQAAQAPIILCHQPAQLETAQQWLNQPWVFNLDNEIVPIQPQSQRILEVVSTEEQCRQHARQRWRHYQTQGYDLQAQELRSRSAVQTK
ncbi:MAG TPA: DNA polymerase III subunit chi [Paenalcaligenes sp.]|nr:DNA polymerase III subunit chi [Paenalcaligenes sp.]